MRSTTLHRKTSETDISVALNLDGVGNTEIATGIGFFDHMLTAFGRHAGLDLGVQAFGDLQVDAHHTIEDTGIVLGKALREALGDRKGIRRYGSASIPMDESLAFCALDISGRPFLVFDCPFAHAMLGGMPTEMAGEFFRALAFNAGVTLHLKLCWGQNDHHKAEALFKALAHAWKEAAAVSGGAILSTKGALD